MKKMIMALAIGALAVGSMPATARSINAKQVDQRRRIDAGERSGKLTHAEAARLKAQQDSIERESTMLKAHNHGHLSAHGKNVLKMRQDQAERAIMRQKDDAQHGKNHLKL